jgi:hypothetical protein
MDWLIGCGFVVVMVHLWWIQYDIRILRTQMNRVAGHPTGRDTTEAASLVGDVDYPPDRKA